MWVGLHYFIVATFILAPVVMAVSDAITGSRERRSRPSPTLLLTIAAGALMGTSLTIIYGVATGGNPPILQICMAVYFATSLLAILKAFDALLRRGVEWVSQRTRGKGRFVRHSSAGAASLLRLVLLFGVGLPYVMAAVVTYRPKVVSRDDPQTQLGFPFERVSFHSSDGIRISGWWIPGIKPSRDAQARGTVVICHGLAASKANQMVMSRTFVPAGYNVLIFDFRAHGESGGQFASFGDLERRDVLAAVRWLRAQRPRESHRILGVGASMGAAALIAAAADPSEDGQAIQAIAVYGTFDDLTRTADSVIAQRLPPPLRQAVQWFAIPMAGAQVGSNLSEFSPGTLIESIWPRPVLVIHGTGDEIIPFERGQSLYQRAFLPKQAIWLEKSSHNSIINDEDTAKKVREFFDSAQPVGVI